MPVMSIIIPAYNAEKYIEKALDSLISQTLSDIEIICVNDGSKDNTLEILKRYARNDARIKIINKPNEGAAAARRAGVEYARSKYIGFLDSDDYYEIDYCKKMVTAMVSGDLDLVECGYYEFTNGTIERRCHFFNDSDLFIENKIDFINKVFNTTIVNGKEAVVNWNKVYKRDLILKYVTNYGESLLEDYLFNLQYYIGVKRYCFIHQTLLNYRISNDSLSKKYNKDFYKILVQIQIQKNSIMKRLELDNSQYNRAADWFCTYVKKYLLFNGVIFRDYGLFKNVIMDTMLVEQASLVNKKDLFSKCVVKGRKFILIAVYTILTLGVKITKSIKRGCI